ncbi:putative glutamate dehydrogenase, NAD-specific [Helianthus anomalus]
MVNHSVIKVLSTKMSVTIGRFDLKDTLFNRQKRYIKSTTTKIKDQHVLLTNTGRLLVKTISDSSSGSHH